MNKQKTATLAVFLFLGCDHAVAPTSTEEFSTTPQVTRVVDCSLVPEKDFQKCMCANSPSLDYWKYNCAGTFPPIKPTNKL